MSELKRFLIDCSVKAAEGTQTFYVDAVSEEEAIVKFEDGGGEMYANEVEVMDLGEPSISGQTTLDDIGTVDGFSGLLSALQASQAREQRLADQLRSAMGQIATGQDTFDWFDAQDVLAEYESTRGEQGK